METPHAKPSCNPTRRLTYSELRNALPKIKTGSAKRGEPEAVMTYV